MCGPLQVGVLDTMSYVKCKGLDPEDSPIYPELGRLDPAHIAPEYYYQRTVRCSVTRSMVNRVCLRGVNTHFLFYLF